MVAAHSLARTRPRWTALQPTLPSDGQVHCEERLVQACTCPALICNWCCQAPLALCGDIRHRTGSLDSR